HHQKAASAVAVGNDLDGDGELHVGVQFHGHQMLSGALDRIIEADLFAIDLDLLLGGDRIGDLGGGDRAEEPILAGRAGRDRDRVVHQGLGDLLGGLAGGGVALLTGPPHALGLVFGAGRGQERQPAGNEVVAAVSGCDLDDVTFVAEPLDIGAEDETHQASTSSASVWAVSAPLWTSSASSTSSGPGGGAVGRGGGPSARTPRSPRSQLPRGCTTRLV